jgi:hypothetical protein
MAEGYVATGKGAGVSVPEFPESALNHGSALETAETDTLAGFQSLPRSFPVFVSQ